jgi:hypothetical protein
MVSNRLLSYLHPYRRRSSFPTMGGRGNQMAKRDDGPTVNESRHGCLGGMEGMVTGRKTLFLSHPSRKHGSDLLKFKKWNVHICNLRHISDESKF